MKFSSKYLKFILYKNITNKNNNNSIFKKIKSLLILLIIIIFCIKKESNKMNLVIPITLKDFYKIKNNFKYHQKFIEGINNLVLIGDKNIETLIQNNSFFLGFPYNFINEKDLIDVDKIKKIIIEKNNESAPRSGWYIQQFLKMEYYKICQDKYYLIWDADTIPVKKVKMFNFNINLFLM